MLEFSAFSLQKRIRHVTSPAGSCLPDAVFLCGPRCRTLGNPAAHTSTGGGAKTGYAAVNGIKVYYTRTGHGSPVVLLHGGLSNSDYWGNQVKALAAKHTVISIDSRGHGRSSRDDKPYGYDLMADDVVAVLDSLKIPRADIVGWSDGAIIGIDLALRHPDRIGKVFAFAANTQTSGVKDAVEKNPTFAAFIERAGKEYAKLSPTPKEYDAFVEQISHM